MSRRTTLAALALLPAAWALTLWLDPWADERVNDLFVYRQVASPLLHGSLPYRDIFFEYPPLAAPVIALPGIAGTGEDVYRLSFAVLALILAGALLLLTARLASLTGGDARRAALAVALAPLACGAMLRTHFDLAPIALTVGALVLVCGGRPRAGMAVLGLGAMTKGFPLLAAPPLIAWLVARGERRAALEGAAALAAVMAVVGLAALAVAPREALEAVRYHLERPVQIESLPASALGLLDGLGLGELRSVNSHRSDGLLHPAAGAVAAAGSLALLALLAFLTALVARRPDARTVTLVALTAVLGFASLGKVLSPQFMIWLVPLAALAFAWRMHALAGATTAAVVLTLAEFPSRYFDLVAREPLPLAIVTARNLVLLAALALAVRAVVAPVSGPARAAARSPWRGRPGPPRPAPR